MKEYTTTHIVVSEDLNHHGTLFGARAAAWFVEAGLITAAKEHGKLNELVIRNILDMSYHRPVQKGSTVDFVSRIVYAGRTSLAAAIEARDAMTGELFISGFISYVTIESGAGTKKPHGIVLDEACDEREQVLRDRAVKLIESRLQ